MKHNTRHLAGITAGILTLAGYASAATLGSEKYTYDASGNIIEKSIDGVVTKMTYDKSNRLAGFQTAGQAKLTTTCDNAERLLDESRDGRSERKLTYQYGDKVTRVEKGETTTELLYNAEGQLVARSAGGPAETFAWDGLGLAMRGGQAFVNEEHLAGGVPALADGQVTVSDPQGSTLSIGEKCFIASAYGEGLEQGLFTGKPFVKEVNGFVFNFRNYNPETGRWTTPDPSGFADGGNYYLYGMCDPIGRVDPLGLKTESEVVDVTITVRNKTIHVVRSYTFDDDTLPDFSGSAQFSGTEKDPSTPSTWEWSSKTLIWINTSNWNAIYIPATEDLGHKYYWKDGAAKGEATLVENSISYPSGDIPNMGILENLLTNEYEY